LLGATLYSTTSSSKIAGALLIDASQIRVILLDIEGTTTPVEFVFQTLFPYASRNLEPFLLAHSRESEIASILEDLRAHRNDDERNGQNPPAWVNDPEMARLRSAVAYGQWLIVRDSKCSPLKSLQGKIWHEGYTTGELHGQVFPDVPVALERWRLQKKIICIYSSGSVLAQQNLFRTTPSGDLTSYISVFFDTRVGAKTEPESYKRISGSFSFEPNQFLFISDAPKEVAAAHSAGMQTLLCERNRNVSSSPAADVIANFDDVFPG